MHIDDVYVRYLTTHERGRLATIAPDGTPHNKPVGYRYNTALGTIDIAGLKMEASAKYRNAGRGQRTWSESRATLPDAPRTEIRPKP